MSLVLNEVQLIQNQALGAYLLHEFALGFSPAKQEPKGLPLQLLFLILPLVLHEATCREITSTNQASGLRLFEHKFDKAKDQLLNFQNRALAMRMLTLDAIRVAIACKLISLNPKTGQVWLVRSKTYKPEFESVVSLGKASRRLGTWLSALTIAEISGILRIDL